MITTFLSEAQDLCQPDHLHVLKLDPDIEDKYNNSINDDVGKKKMDAAYKCIHDK